MSQVNSTENGDPTPFTITGVSSADIGGVSLTQNFTVLNNNKTFNVTADSAFEGTETFNLVQTTAVMILMLVLTTQVMVHSKHSQQI